MLALLLVGGPLAFSSATTTSLQDYLESLTELGRVQRGQIPNLAASDDGTHLIASKAAVAPADNADDGVTQLRDAYHDETHVLLSLPQKYILTEKELRDGVLSHFLEAPKFLEMIVKEKISAPSSFVFTLFYLFHLHARGRPHGDLVWERWARYHHAARTGENALWRWLPIELRVFEEERLAESARDFATAINEQYDKLMLPIARQFPDFFPPREITREEFLHAAGVAMSQRALVDGMGGHVADEASKRGEFYGKESRDQIFLLQPLPLRQHPEGVVRLEHVEQELLTPNGEVRTRFLVNLVTLSGTAPKPGQELSLVGPRYNDQLLLECGYMWNELRAASVPLRMVLSKNSDVLEDTYERRLQLLDEAKLNETQDFILTTGALPPKLRLWSRINLGTNDEIRNATSFRALEVEQSMVTEDAVNVNLINSVGSVRAHFDHGVEEDDYLLEKSSKHTLGVREAIAVRNRRLSKVLLERRQRASTRT